MNNTFWPFIKGLLKVSPGSCLPNEYHQLSNSLRTLHHYVQLQNEVELFQKHGSSYNPKV